MKSLCFALISSLLVGLSPVHAELYRHIDEQGNVVFTDVPPTPDAEPVQLPPVNSMPPPELPAASESQPRPRDSQTGNQAVDQAYQVLAIRQPTNDASIRDNAGRVALELQLQPALKTGHQVRVLLDGRRVASGRKTRFTIENVDRGSHDVQAEVVDGTGTVRAQSDPVRFHLQRHSILHRQ